MTTTTSNTEFMQAYNGRLVALRQWSDLEAFWKVLLSDAETSWYVYAIGEPPPQTPVDHAKLETVVGEIDTLLHRDHDESYCGIVYVDDREKPTFVKIYDPNNLGSVCGSSGTITLPGWTISKAAPEDLKMAFPLPANRRRWWKKLFA